MRDPTDRLAIPCTIVFLTGTLSLARSIANNALSTANGACITYSVSLTPSFSAEDADEGWFNSSTIGLAFHSNESSAQHCLGQHGQLFLASVSMAALVSHRRSGRRV